MDRKKTIYTDNRKWKAKIEAIKLWAYFYSEIGSKVKVYKKEKTTNVWGNSKTQWVEKKAKTIRIYNKYFYVHGKRSYNYDADATWNNVSKASLGEWAFGFGVTVDAQPGSEPSATPAGSAVHVDLDGVKATISVRTSGGSMSGNVNAGRTE